MDTIRFLFKYATSRSFRALCNQNAEQAMQEKIFIENIKRLEYKLRQMYSDEQIEYLHKKGLL